MNISVSLIFFWIVLYNTYKQLHEVLKHRDDICYTSPIWVSEIQITRSYQLIEMYNKFQVLSTKAIDDHKVLITSPTYRDKILRLLLVK